MSGWMLYGSTDTQERKIEKELPNVGLPSERAKGKISRVNLPVPQPRSTNKLEPLVMSVTL